LPIDTPRFSSNDHARNAPSPLLPRNWKSLGARSGKYYIEQVYTIKRMKANWIGHILRRNCLLKHVIAGKTEERRRRGRRLKQLLDDVKEKRIFGNLKEEES